MLWFKHLRNTLLNWQRPLLIIGAIAAVISALLLVLYSAPLIAWLGSHVFTLFCCIPPALAAFLLYVIFYSKQPSNHLTQKNKRFQASLQ